MNEFDERQLWIRGNIFKHMFLLCFTLFTLNAFIYELGILWCSNFRATIIILSLTIMVGSIEMIYHDVYISHIKSKSNRWEIYPMGLLAFAIILLSLYEIRNGSYFILPNGSLSSRATNLIVGINILLIVITYILKDQYNRKLYKEEA